MRHINLDLWFFLWVDISLLSVFSVTKYLLCDYYFQHFTIWCSFLWVKQVQKYAFQISKSFQYGIYYMKHDYSLHKCLRKQDSI